MTKLDRLIGNVVNKDDDSLAEIREHEKKRQDLLLQYVKDNFTEEEIANQNIINDQGEVNPEFDFFL